MSYLLRSDNGQNEYVDIPDITTSTNVWSFYLDFKLNTVDQGTAPYLLSADSGTVSRVILFDNSNGTKSVRLRTNGGNFDFDVSSFDFLLRTKFEFISNGTDLQLLVNGALHETKAGGAHVISTAFGRISEGPFSVVQDLDLYEAYFDPGFSRESRYDPSSSNGTGSILPDTISGQDGALVGFPVDDSQWVFYDDGAGGEDNLTANDISSTSQVSSPAIAQTHALTADDLSSLSSVTAPAIGQTHSLTSTDLQSTSELTQPALSSASTVDSLSANDIGSASSVSAPALGQVHNLAANDAASNTETGTPILQQEHALTSVSLDSLSTVSTPALTSVAGQDSLAANDISSESTVSSPTLAQVHVLQTNNAQAQTKTSEPAIGQVHQLTANDLASVTQVSTPTLRDASQVLVTPIKNTRATVSQVAYKATVSQTTYKAAIIQTVYKAEAG